MIDTSLMYSRDKNITVYTLDESQLIIPMTKSYLTQ